LSKEVENFWLMVLAVVVGVLGAGVFLAVLSRTKLPVLKKTSDFVSEGFDSKSY